MLALEHSPSTCSPARREDDTGGRSQASGFQASRGVDRAGELENFGAGPFGRNFARHKLLCGGGLRLAEEVAEVEEVLLAGAPFGESRLQPPGDELPRCHAGRLLRLGVSPGICCWSAGCGATTTVSPVAPAMIVDGKSSEPRVVAGNMVAFS